MVIVHIAIFIIKPFARTIFGVSQVQLEVNTLSVLKIEFTKTTAGTAARMFAVCVDTNEAIDKSIILMFGNDDWPAAYELLQSHLLNVKFQELTK